MKKITMYLFVFFFSAVTWQTMAQLTEDFEGGFVNLTNVASNDLDFAIETTLFHGGAQSVKNAYASSQTNVLEQTAAMDLSATTTPLLEFWHIAKTEGGYDECYVEISTDGGATYAALLSAEYLGSGDYSNGLFDEDSYTDWGTSGTTVIDNTKWKKETFDLSAYKVANVKIRFRLTSDSSVTREGWYIDDVQVFEAPSCLFPLAMTDANLAPTSVDLSWTAGGSETTWEVVYDVDPYAMPANGLADATGEPGYMSVATTPTVSLSGLTDNTTYNVYYRADCGAGDYSDWASYSFTTLPANDLAVNAIAVACGDTVIGDTTYATIDPQGDCGSVDNDAPNVFYTFTGTGTAENVTLSLCNSGYDTSIAVFTGTPGALVCYANNDDSCGTQSEVTFTSDGTQTYYIMIEGWGATSVGAYEMVVSCAPACTPAVTNQDCASAMALTLNDPAVSSDNTCATTNINNPSCDQFGTIADVWFSVVVPNSGELNVTTTLGTATDVNVAVYEGTCGALTEVAGACADATGTANSLTLTGLNAGDTYYIQAWNAGTGEEGTFDIEVTGTVVSVADLQAVGFTYYPNPVKNSLMMKADETISSVSIFNMLGQEVKRMQPSALETSVDMSNLSSGTYFVKATVGSAVGTFKVIKD